jgi:hypothetical protein
VIQTNWQLNASIFKRTEANNYSELKIPGLNVPAIEHTGFGTYNKFKPDYGPQMRRPKSAKN